MNKWFKRNWVRISLFVLMAVLLCGALLIGRAWGGGERAVKTVGPTTPAAPQQFSQLQRFQQPPVTVIVNPPAVTVNVTVTQIVNGMESQSSSQKLTTPTDLRGLSMGVLEGLVYEGNFNTYKGTIKESVIDHDWGLGGPFGLTRFSIKWRGAVLVQDAGYYRFAIRADDSIRLYIDDVLLIDKWISPQAATDYTADIQLAQGSHKILLKYFNDVQGDSVMKLSCWKIY